MESTVRDEVLSSVRSLPTIARLRLLLEISREELERFEHELTQLEVRSEELDRLPKLLAEDGCPYSPEQLRAMRRETGGKPLAEVFSRLGLS